MAGGPLLADSTAVESKAQVPPPAPSTPVKTLPSKVIFKSTHGKYIVAEPGGGVFANRVWADDWEKFEVTELGEGDLAFKSFHGFFLTADMAGTMFAGATSLVHDAHFKVETRADGAVALKTVYGKFVAAEPSGFMIGNRFRRDDWEHFEVIDMADQWPGHVAIKTITGNYLRAYPHGALRADGTWPLDDWERFHVSHHDHGVISLRCDHGEYIAVEEDGRIHASNSATASEFFEVVHLADGNFTMKSRFGKFVFAKRDGTVLANYNGTLDDREKFRVVMVP